jgi:hypothetical protein
MPTFNSGSRKDFLKFTIFCREGFQIKDLKQYRLQTNVNGWPFIDQVLEIVLRSTRKYVEVNKPMTVLSPLALKAQLKLYRYLC